MFAVWKNSTDGLAPIIEPIPSIAQDESNFLIFNITISKGYFGTAPAQADPNGLTRGLFTCRW